MAALSAGCPHHPPTPRRRVSAAFAATRSPRCSGARRRVALPWLPRGSRARGERVAPLPPIQSQLTGVARRELDGARTAWATRAWFAFPWLRTCPGLPARTAEPAAEPGPGACASSGPAPALSRAPSLPRTLGQTWGGLLRAIGLGRCSDPALRISPGFGAPFVDRRESSQASDSPLTPPTTPCIPQVPLHPSPGAQGFETVVTPQRKRVRTSLRVEHGSQVGVCGVSRRFWVFVPGERALWGQKR